MMMRNAAVLAIAGALIGCGNQESIPKIARNTTPSAGPTTTAAPQTSSAPANASAAPVKSVDAKPAAAASGWGSIKGRVVWTGELPKPKALSVTQDAAWCLMKGPLNEEMHVVNQKNKGVLNVFAYLRDKNLPVHPDYPKTAADTKAAFESEFEKLNGFKIGETQSKVNEKKVEISNIKVPGAHYNPKHLLQLDQVHCLYVPHFLALREGQPLLVKNGEPVAHNVKVGDISGVGNESNNNMPGGTIGILNWSASAQPLLIQCSIHSWMTMNAMVFNHPYYAITGDDGNFEIKNVPAGEVTLVLRQPAYIDPIKGGKGAVQGAKVTVKAGETLDLGEIKWAGQ